MCVGHSVVPPEDPGGGDVTDHHVDAVVLVSDEDAEDSGGAEQPTQPVIPPHPARRVCDVTANQRKSKLWYIWRLFWNNNKHLQ